METDSETMNQAFADPAQSPEDAVEERDVLKWQRRIEEAREHDKPARAQYAVDRRYAAGTTDQSLAVDTNLVGNYIDILVDYLYAKDPDVSCQPAEEVTTAMPDETPIPPQPPAVDPETGLVDPMAAEAFAAAEAQFANETLLREQAAIARRKERAERQDFAATLQIVISKLWKRGRLKRAVKRQVRSCLSIGPGWIKAVMLSEDVAKNPEVQQKLNELKDNLDRIRARRAELAERLPDDIELAERELAEQIAGLEPTLEVVIRKTFAIDFVAAQDMTVSTDVRYIDDYLDASFCSNRVYVKKSELRAKFPRLTDEDVKAATSYYMRSPRETIRPGGALDITRLTPDGMDAGDAEEFVSEKTASAGGFGTGEKGDAFALIEEIWDRNSNHVKTLVEGVKRWAKPAFTPKYATTRFYPYFYLAFYEVDGARHPQSCAGRLAKLADEYGETRSSFRLARRRATPGTLFNKTQVSPESARRIEEAVEQEYVGVEPTNPTVSLKDLFAPKPVAVGDMALYDTTPIVRDMERISGVQEAKQSSASRSKTATEAQIEESGFVERTNADRDALDDMLTELAQYTAELALGCLTYQDVKRMAGPDAFWPTALPVEELTDLVQVDIEAGSTGRPNRREEREAWATLLPLIRQDLLAIQQARAVGNEPLAKALIALLTETWKRSGGRGDIARFIPEAPPLPAPGVMPAPGAAAPAGTEAIASAPLDGNAGAPQPNRNMAEARMQ